MRSLSLVAFLLAAAPALARLQPGTPLDVAFAPGDKTGQSIAVAFTPDRDGPRTVTAHSLVLDANLEIRRRRPDGTFENLARVEGDRKIDPTLVVDLRSGDDITIVVTAWKSHACGPSVTLSATPGSPPRRPDAEIVASSGTYWDDSLAAARAAGDAACEVRALLGQHAAARREARFKEAADLVEQAIAAASRLPGESNPFLAWALNAKGRLVREQNDMDTARLLLEKAAALIEAHYGPAHPVTADALIDLAELYGNMDRYEDQRATLERVLAIREKALPPGDMEIGKALNDLGVAAVQAGDYGRARLLMEQVVAMAEAQVTLDEEEVVSFLNNLAYVERHLGDDEAARASYERVLAVQRAIVPLNRKSVARTASNLASVMLDLGDLASARTLVEETVALDTDVYGPDHSTTAVNSLKLAGILSRQGHFDEARDRARQAVAAVEGSVGPRHTLLAGALASRAVIERDAGHPEEALPLVDRAVAMGESILGPTHPDLASPLRLRAAIHLDLRRDDAALADALRAEALGRDQLRLATRALAQDSALRYAATRPRGLDLALRLQAATGSPSADQTRRVWDSLIRSRAVVFDEIASRTAALAEDDLATIPLRSELQHASSRLADLLVRASDKDPPKDIAAQIEAAKAARDQAEEALAARSAAFREGRAVASAGFDDVTGALAPGETLVAYVRFDRTAGARRQPEAPHDEAYAAFVLSGPHGAPLFVPLGSAAPIDAAVATWRGSLFPNARGLVEHDPARESAARAAGVALRRLVWDPVANRLGGAVTVDLVPDGALSRVNFAALPAAGDRFLVETGPLLQSISAERDLAARAAPRRTSRSARVLVMGGPDFGTTAGTAMHDFAALPEAAAEAGDVAALLRRDRSLEVSVLTGPAATESAFKRLAPSSRYLHVATHGFWNAGGEAAASDQAVVADAVIRQVTNPLDLSGLALAGANRRNAEQSSREDGLLTAEEIAAMNLGSVEWVVLSGCDTGLGETDPGEGLLGLQRAFRVAGARGLVVSLWRIPDEATREWMSLFYKALRPGARPAEALRKAAREWIAAQRKAGQPADPRVWGAFIASGPGSRE